VSIYCCRNNFVIIPEGGKGANPQSELTFFPIPEEGKGIMPWLFFGVTTPAPASVDPQCNNQPVIFVFLPLKGECGKPAIFNLLLFFSFRKGEGGK